MKNNKSANRYAKALYMSAVNKSITELILKDSLFITKTYNDNIEIKSLISNPIISDNKKQEILNKIFSGNIDALTQDMILLLISKKRSSIIKDVASEYIAIYNNVNKIYEGEIISSIELSDEQIEKILTKSNIKGSINLIKKVDKSLIGGFILKIENTILDKSIKSRLAKMIKEHTK